jgi:hypothetical protein
MIQPMGIWSPTTNALPAAHREGAMFASIPLDIWVAAVLAAAAGLMAIFGPSAGVFITVYLCVCAYIVAEVINDEIAG